MQRRALPTLVFLFPFLYYFRFVFPNSGMLYLQNDFTSLYFDYKAYQLDLWAHGHFPFWSPAEGGGYAFFGNPFAGVLYPLNLLLLLVRLAAGFYGVWFHQIFTILGVSIFALGLYVWLVRCFARPMAAAFAALAISTCWGVGEFLRFPNAIHVLAWVPWGLAALHALHNERKLRHVYMTAAVVVLQLTAGYPYFVIYSFLLYAAYLLYLHAGTGWAEWRQRGVRQALALGLPLLLLLPYTSAVSRLMSATTDRGGGNFTYATEYTFGPLDLVGSLLFPPVASVEGCIYMGSLAMFLVALYVWRGTDAREKAALLVGFMGFVTLMLGFRSFLFAPFWSFVPVINQMRVFGRMAIMLLPIFAVALHQGFAYLAEQLEAPAQKRELTPRAALVIFGSIFVVQAYLHLVPGGDTAYKLLTVPTLPESSKEIDFPMHTLLTLAVVLVLLHVDWSRLRNRHALWFGALLWVVTLDTGAQGRYLWARPVAPCLTDVGVPEGGNLTRRIVAAGRLEGDFYPLVRDYFDLDRAGPATGLTPKGLTRGVVPNWDYARYSSFLGQWAGDAASLDGLLGKTKLFFHQRLPADPKELLADAHAADSGPSTLAVTRFDGNELQLAATTPRPGYVSWIDNWDEGWTATVDGTPVAVERLLDTFKTVPVPTAGKHTVTFRYRPPVPRAAYAGAALGLFLLLLPLLPLGSLRRRFVWAATS